MGLDAPYTGRALEERLGHLPVTAASASPESSISDAGARDNSAEDSGDAGVWAFEGSGVMGPILCCGNMHVAGASCKAQCLHL